MAKRGQWLILVGIFLVSGTVHPLAAQVPDGVRGRDLVAAVNFSKDDLKADGRLFLPERVSRVRAVIAVTHWGLGDDVYADPDIRGLAASTDSVLLLFRVTRISTNELDNRPVLIAPAQDAVLAILRRFAEESGRPEIATAPLLFWGHSQGGNAGAAFAALHPERTIAFGCTNRLPRCRCGPRPTYTPWLACQP